MTTQKSAQNYVYAITLTKILCACCIAASAIAALAAYNQLIDIDNSVEFQQLDSVERLSTLETALSDSREKLRTCNEANQHNIVKFNEYVQHNGRYTTRANNEIARLEREIERLNVQNTTLRKMIEYKER